MRMTEYGINVPDDLLTQLENEQLVLFVGAGISILAPSNLKSFLNLTRGICKEAGVPFSKRLSLDNNLSRVLKAGAGYDVHQRVIEKLSPPKSKPNQWHETLLHWFECGSKVRIVTTNFDKHLSDAAIQMGWSVPEYVAPVLPLGDNFQGIVYLHGRLDNKESIIVTGEDFGKAYLNYAWAARFLQAMFAQYTVLFIGYSNHDPLVRYLTSGLSMCANKHYAFTSKDAQRDWDELDIEPILFEQPRDEKYKAMLQVAKEIAQQYCMSELEHEMHMREIISTANKVERFLSPQDHDYLLRSLKKPNRQRHFCRLADGEFWFHWAMKYIPEVQSLFNPMAQVGEAAREYAMWIAGYFENADILLLQELVKRKLNSALWYQIGSEILYQKLSIPTDRLVAWIYILLRDATEPGHWELLQDMLEGDKIPQSSHVGWAIFSRLTKPNIQFSKNLYTKNSTEERPVLPSITIPSNDPQELCEYWKNVLRKQFSDIHDQVRGLVTLYLTEAYYMLIEQGAWSTGIDEVSYGRTDIINKMTTDEFSLVRPMDPLIDAAVDLINWYANNNLRLLNTSIANWNDSKVPILRRLSLYGVSRVNWSADEKYQWLVTNQYLNEHFFYREPQKLLRSIFSELSSENQEKVVGVLLQEITGSEGVELNRNHGIRIYYLLQNLIEENEDNPYLAAAFVTVKTLLEKKGIEYQKEAHVKQSAETDVSKLLDGDIEAALHWYDEIEKTEDWTSGQGGQEKFQAAFTDKAAKDLDWAINIADVLWRQDSENAHYLGRLLLNIFGDAELTNEQQSLLYQKIYAIVDLQSLGDALAFFLRKRADKNFYGNSDQFIDEFLNCVDYILEWAVKVPFSKDPGRGWLEAVINHPVYDLILVLLRILSDRGKDSKYIAAVTTRLSKLMDEENITKIVEVICARQVHFLYSVVPDWTITNIISLFDWNKSEEQAERAWAGFLFGGHFIRNLVSRMLSYFVATVDHLEYLDERRYCEHLAALSMRRFIEKPFATKNLGKVVLKLNDNQRARCFEYIGLHLSHIKDKGYRQWIWKSALMPLMEIRSRMKRELAADELMAILKWVPESADFCAPLIGKIICFSTEKIKACHKLRCFQDTTISETQPAEFAKLWIWLADRLTPGEQSNRIYKEIAKKILDNPNVLPKDKESLTESLSALGMYLD